ncbi:MAG: Lrp/AsnC ligand binding domain-containing protein [Actinomycetota bacterium]
MDAYVFVKEASQESLDRLQGLVGTGGIRFVTSLSGPYDGLVAVQADDLPALEAVVRDEIRPTGVTGTETAIVVPIIPPLPMPKWTPPDFAVEAFVAVDVAQGQAQSVLNAASEIEGFLGGAIVAGGFDVLLEFAGSSYEQVADILLNQLHTINGISSTSSYFASFPAASTSQK